MLNFSQPNNQTHFSSFFFQVCGFQQQRSVRRGVAGKKDFSPQLCVQKKCASDRVLCAQGVCPACVWEPTGSWDWKYPRNVVPQQGLSCWYCILMLTQRTLCTCCPHTWLNLSLHNSARLANNTVLRWRWWWWGGLGTNGVPLQAGDDHD